MGVKPRENQPTTAPERPPRVQMLPVILYSEPALMSWLRGEKTCRYRDDRNWRRIIPWPPDLCRAETETSALARLAAGDPHRHRWKSTRALQALVDAAEAFAHSPPPSQETDRERVALMEAYLGFRPSC